MEQNKSEPANVGNHLDYIAEKDRETAQVRLLEVHDIAVTGATVWISDVKYLELFFLHF